MDFNSVINELERGERAYKTFAQAKEAVLVLQNYEQVKKESIEAANTAIAEKEKAVTDLNGVLADIESAKVQAKELRAKAKEKADSAVAAAESKAADIIKAANEKLAEANAKVGALADEAKAAEAAKADAEKELAEINSKLEAAKAQIKSLLA